MKTQLMRLIFYLPFATIILAKILNWVIGFNDSTNDLINKAMFIFIGVSYLIFGYALDQLRYRLITMVCGIFLISMNFLPKNNYMIAAAIISILATILIRRFLIKNETENSVPE